MLINIFGGIICCDKVADAILFSLSKIQLNIPIVIRLEGNKSNIGINRLIQQENYHQFIIANDFIDAIKKSIFFSNKKSCLYF